MSWLVFGDDWGRHPSTTQHLARHLGERVVWVDSLAMRSPRPSIADARRIWGRLTTRATARGTAADPSWLVRPRPRVLPWHLASPVRAANRRAIRYAVLPALDGDVPLVVAANPVAAFYLDALPHRAIAYLRLDDYAELPGVDPALARAAERRMLEVAAVVVGTARGLLPPGVPGLYLPQGVDADHFGTLPLDPPAARVLGFFGLVAPWIDLDLVAAVARAAPDWTLELVGRVDADLAPLAGLPNVRVLPPVPYDALPAALSGWRAAWAPFRLNDLTRAVNPLKVREYLAAGLPTFCTPLPEVESIPSVRTGRTAGDVATWLAGEDVAGDSAAARAARRRAVAGDSWASRARTLRDRLERAARDRHPAPSSTGRAPALTVSAAEP